MKGILSGFLIWLLHVPLNNAYLGIAISNLKSTHKDHPPQAAQTFNYSRPQIILNTFWLVLLVVSFTSPLGFLSFPFIVLSISFPFMFLSCLFLSFHCPFLSFPFIVLSISFPFLSLSFPFLSFHCPFLSFPFIVLSFPFLFKSRFSRIFSGNHIIWSPHLIKGGGFINKRPTLHVVTWDPPPNHDHVDHIHNMPTLPIPAAPRGSEQPVIPDTEQCTGVDQDREPRAAKR